MSSSNSPPHRRLNNHVRTVDDGRFPQSACAVSTLFILREVRHVGTEDRHYWRLITRHRKLLTQTSVGDASRLEMFASFVMKTGNPILKAYLS